MQYKNVILALISTSSREPFKILREIQEISTIKETITHNIITYPKIPNGYNEDNKVSEIMMAVIKHDRDDIMQYILENNDLITDFVFLKYMIVACMKRARNIIKLLINNKHFSYNMLPTLLQYNIPELKKLAFEHINF
jgi:hypothetical protein